MTHRVHVANPGDGEKVTGEHTEGRLTVIEGSLPAESPGPPAHVHNDCDKSFYVLEGELTVRIDDQEVSAPAGTYVLVPRGATHRPSNPFGVPCRFLMLFSPSGMEHFFREQATIDWDALDDAGINDLARRHQMEWRFGSM